MNRLLTELDRLYLVGPAGVPPAARLVDATGGVRAMVFEVLQPAGWDALSKVWQGVQTELELPAPGIAASGRDGLQLWFSLESAIPARRATVFLEALAARFLPDTRATRIRLLPDAADPVRHPALVPALQADTGNWSAYVAPDLAAIFSEAPWLDVEPGEEGQAALLRGLQSIKPGAFESAAERLDARARDARASSAATATTAAAASPADAEPRRFLMRVMNDDSVPLALRIEAAKALLARD
jgi:hypothetical protein